MKSGTTALDPGAVGVGVAPQRSPLMKSGTTTRNVVQGPAVLNSAATEPAHEERGDQVLVVADLRAKSLPQRSPLMKSGATPQRFPLCPQCKESRNGARS